MADFLHGSWADVEPKLKASIIDSADKEGIHFVWISSPNSVSKLKSEAGSRYVALYPAIDKPDSTQLLANRSAAIEQPAPHWLHLQLPATEPAEGWSSWLMQQLKGWLTPTDACTQAELKQRQVVGSRVTIDPEDEATHFMVGHSKAITDLLDQLDTIKRRFRNQIGSKVDVRREKVHQALKPLLQREVGKKTVDALNKALESAGDGAVPRKLTNAQPAALPKVLVLGPSGAGKSFVSRYLSRRTSAEEGGKAYRPFNRIPIPDYLGAEERLEYDLFGYCGGAYTGGREEGEMGILLTNLGGVIFLDEIGEASPALQAKLLAFMDDYKVKPRSWNGEGIFCPLLLIAATNKPVDAWAEADEAGKAEQMRFRHDLFQRFDAVIRLPGLNERREDLPLLIDALLQLEAINPGGRVTAITTAAVAYLQQEVDYQKGNFRQLRRILMEGCRRADLRREAVMVKRDVAVPHPFKRTE